MASLDKLPTELIQQIAMDLDSPQDRVALSRVSKTLFVNVLPVLYRHHSSTLEAVKWAAEKGRLDILEAAVRYSENVADMLNSLPPSWPYCPCLYPGLEDCPHPRPTDTYKYATPLHVAAYHGQDEVVKFLLAHGAAINAMSLNYCPCNYHETWEKESSDLFSWTPLHHAICSRHLSTAKLLLDHGASMEIGQNLSLFGDDWDFLFARVKRVYPLHSRDSGDYTDSPVEYSTVLHMAAAAGDLDTVKLIKERYQEQSRLGITAERPVVVEEYILPCLPWGDEAKTALDYLHKCNKPMAVKKQIFNILKSMGLESHLHFYSQGLEHKYQLEPSSAEHHKRLVDLSEPLGMTWEAEKPYYEEELVQDNSLEDLVKQIRREERSAKHLAECEDKEKRETDGKNWEKMERVYKAMYRDGEKRLKQLRQVVERETELQRQEARTEENEKEMVKPEKAKPEKVKRRSERLKRKREDQEKGGDKSMSGREKRRG